jgi:hypothetical protein
MSKCKFCCHCVVERNPIYILSLGLKPSSQLLSLNTLSVKHTVIHKKGTQSVPGVSELLAVGCLVPRLLQARLTTVMETIHLDIWNTKLDLANFSQEQTHLSRASLIYLGTDASVYSLLRLDFCLTVFTLRTR